MKYRTINRSLFVVASLIITVIVLSACESMEDQQNALMKEYERGYSDGQSDYKISEEEKQEIIDDFISKSIENGDGIAIFAENCSVNADTETRIYHRFSYEELPCINNGAFNIIDLQDAVDQGFEPCAECTPAIFIDVTYQIPYDPLE